MRVGPGAIGKAPYQKKTYKNNTLKQTRNLFKKIKQPKKPKNSIKT